MSTGKRPTRESDQHMLLAGDIGGTKTHLGLFEPAAPRPRPIAVATFGTLDYPGLPEIIDEFLTSVSSRDGAEGQRRARPDGGSITITEACFGVAGPIIHESAQLTNVPWRVEARPVAKRFGFRRARLLNDLQAMAYAVPLLMPSEVHVLQAGVPLEGGNIALIAAGTGLGEALLHNVDGRFVPAASEGGHADFSARTDREIALLRALTRRYGRVDVERVVSGPGLVNIHRELHQRDCGAAIDLESADAPAAITTSAIEGRCRECVETLDCFVEAYGAEAGNLALRLVATGGVFIGGGIAPKILGALANGSFTRTFRSKPPLEPLLASIPVKVILNDRAAMLGAAVFASRE